MKCLLPSQTPQFNSREMRENIFYCSVINVITEVTKWVVASEVVPMGKLGVVQGPQDLAASGQASWRRQCFYCFPVNCYGAALTTGS